MNRAKLIKKISTSASLTQAGAKRAVNAFEQIAAEALSQGDTISLVGFGNFSVVERAARKCRNPQTGEKMQIPAKKVVRFKVGKRLADTVK